MYSFCMILRSRSILIKRQDFCYFMTSLLLRTAKLLGLNHFFSANILNDHFSSVGNRLASTIPTPQQHLIRQSLQSTNFIFSILAGNVRRSEISNTLHTKEQVLWSLVKANQWSVSMLRSDWISYYQAICYSPLVAKSAGFLAAKRDLRLALTS